MGGHREAVALDPAVRMTPARGPQTVALLVLVFLLLPAVHAFGMEGEAVPAPQTGNAWIDVHLVDMDAYAARYRDAFVDEIVRYHEAPRALVEEALADEAVGSGNAYFACSLAQAIGRPCRTVIDAWRTDASGGWQGVAERLGVTQIAGIHRRIRGDISESYVRWARPLDPAASPKR